MKNNIKILSMALSFLFFVIACNKSDQQEKAERAQLNPNGDSELAILMRDMYDEAIEIRKNIENGERPEINLDHSKIMTASATEPEKKATSEYEAFGTVHVQNMQTLENADPSKMLVLYENMVNNCINCHKELCPGPIGRIKKLKGPLSEL